MARTHPVEQLCDCRCPVHHGRQRTTYANEQCACSITCATQPMTLLAEQWGCALFLDHGGDLWRVPQLPAGQWDWMYASEIDQHHDRYKASVAIEHLLRRVAQVLDSGDL